jgi:hypothetical protein
VLPVRWQRRKFWIKNNVKLRSMAKVKLTIPKNREEQL